MLGLGFIRTTVLMGMLAAGAVPSQAELDQAERPYGECIRLAAETMDDGGPDVMAIAEAVRASCLPKFHELLEEVGGKLPPEERRAFEESLSSIQGGIAVAAVCKVRQMKQQPCRLRR